MPLIAVGGQAKNIGKTTLVCNILAAFPQVAWIAVKCTTHDHSPLNSELFVESQGVSIWRQAVAGDESDTARFLKAGAHRALLVRSAESNAKAASDILTKQLSSAAHVIVESTLLAEFLDPDLFLLVIDSVGAKLKKSAQKLFLCADAFVRSGTEELSTDTEKIVRGKPIFEAQPERLDPELASLISGLVKYSV